MKPFILHELARRELHEAALYYSAESFGLSERWLAAFEVVARKIRSNPRTGRPFRSGTRQCRIKGFPYTIVFENRPDDVHFVAIIHLRRRPDYWIDRLGENRS